MLQSADAASSGHGSAPKTRPLRRALRRWWPYLRWILGIALLAAAFGALRGHEEELSTLPTVLENLRWGWLLPAAIVEAASYVAFAGVQYQLLGAGGLRPPIRPLIAVTVGGQAINNSLPGGPALAAVYAFRWFRRFGADDTLAGWALVGTGVTAAVTLALVAAGGLAMATAEGASLDLVPVLIGVLVVVLVIGALFVYERPMIAVVGLTVRACKRVFGRPRRDSEAAIDAVMSRLTAVHLGWRDVLKILGWGSSNWLLDCACFAFAFLAIGAPIPWRGLLLAYGAGQLAANLPITPGGLGVVEGSITIALVAFGGARVSTVDAVVVYRLLSFWAALIVGWVLAGVMAWQVHRGRWAHRALEAPIVTLPAPGEEELVGTSS